MPAAVETALIAVVGERHGGDERSPQMTTSLNMTCKDRAERDTFIQRKLMACTKQRVRDPCQTLNDVLSSPKQAAGSDAGSVLALESE